MDHALTEAGKKHFIGNRFLAIGHCRGTIAVMDKYQIKIRSISQLDASQLAVGNHGKTFFLVTFSFTHIGTSGITMTTHHVPPGLVQHGF